MTYLQVAGTVLEQLEPRTAQAALVESLKSVLRAEHALLAQIQRIVAADDTKDAYQPGTALKFGSEGDYFDVFVL